MIRKIGIGEIALEILPKITIWLDLETLTRSSAVALTITIII